VGWPLLEQRQDHQLQVVGEELAPARHAIAAETSETTGAEFAPEPTPMASDGEDRVGSKGMVITKHILRYVERMERASLECSLAADVPVWVRDWRA
jgi:hypothetical protein